MQDFADQLGISLDELVSRASSAVSTTLTVAEHADQFLKHRKKNTRRTYATAIRRFVYGFGPVCDTNCEPCIDPRNDYQCQCDCGPCRNSRITLLDISHEPVSSKKYNRAALAAAGQIALRSASKRGIDENRRRAAKGLPAKRADGRGAQESAIAALRALFQEVPELVAGYDGKDVKKPKPLGGSRRAMRDFELLELFHFTAVGGDDPELDTLVVEYGIHTGSRRSGAYEVTIGQLRSAAQMIRLKDKNGVEVDMPVSADLIRRLLLHAIERGGPRCDPNDPQYQPDAPVFYYKARNGTYRPITSRRFDTLHRRWQDGLAWAAEEQVGYHHLRHTISHILKTHYGQQYANRYLRHAPDSVTDMYGVCTTEELARAMSELLEYEHPLVGGQDERRAQVHRNLGVE